MLVWSGKSRTPVSAINMICYEGKTPQIEQNSAIHFGKSQFTQKNFEFLIHTWIHQAFSNRSQPRQMELQNKFEFISLPTAQFNPKFFSLQVSFNFRKIATQTTLVCAAPKCVKTWRCEESDAQKWTSHQTLVYRMNNGQAQRVVYHYMYIYRSCCWYLSLHL